MATKSKKKLDTALINVRIEEHLRDAFVELCQDRDTSASREIRDFIRKYVSRHGQQKLL